jgi:hypothetical protein
MSETIIGIDPGQEGSMAVLSGKTLQIARLDEGGIIGFLHNCKPGKAFIEFIDSRKRWGKSGIAQMRSISENFGYWRGVLDGVGIKYELVESSVFESVCGCKLAKYEYAAQKEANFQAAKRLYPNFKICKYAADAVLIAHYGSMRT